MIRISNKEKSIKSGDDIMEKQVLQQVLFKIGLNLCEKDLINEC